MRATPEQCAERVADVRTAGLPGRIEQVIQSELGAIAAEDIGARWLPATGRAVMAARNDRPERAADLLADVHERGGDAALGGNDTGGRGVRRSREEEAEARPDEEQRTQDARRIGRVDAQPRQQDEPDRGEQDSVGEALDQAGGCEPAGDERPDGAQPGAVGGGGAAGATGAEAGRLPRPTMTPRA